MAVIVNGDGILTGVSSLTTALDDITSGRGTITGVTTVGTLQLGAGVSISSPRSQNAAIFTNNSEFLTVDDAGRVGVGTVTPNSDAHPQNVGKINVGFITARSVAGDIDANTLVVAGLSTFTGVIDANGGVTGNVTGNVTGTASGNAVLTGSTNNQLVTVTGANAITGESNVNIVSGNLIAGHTASTTVSDGETPFIQVKSTDSRGGVSLLRHSANAAGGGLYIGKSRNATIGSNTILQDNDELGRITFSGDDGNDIHTQGAAIHAFVDGTPDSNDMPASLRFYTNAGGSAVTERVRITSSGDFGIGTNSPDRKLDVSGTGNVYGKFQSTNATGAGIEVKDTAQNWLIQADGAGSYSSLAFYDKGNTTYRFHMKDNGNLQIVDGDLVVASGHGIDFSATGQAASPSSEILDDYEEGTWTFAIVPGGGSYQYNYGQTGYYRKIGNTVFINAWVHLVVLSTVSGGISLTGLPFACQSRSRNWIPVGGYGQSSGPSSSGLWMICTPGATTASFIYNNTNFGAATTLTAGNLGTSAEMYINGSYFTDA